MDFLNKLLAAMAAARVYIDGEINLADYNVQRFRPKNYRKRGKEPIFLYLLDGGASFGDWRDPSTWKTWWERSWSEISNAEREARKAAQEKLIHERRLLQNHAIWRAGEMLKHRTWRGDTCHEAHYKDHPDASNYVKSKQINPVYGYQIRSYLVLPITDVYGNLQSLQYIKQNGFKQFKKHATPKGGMIILGDSIKKDDVIRICEGYATGCSIYEAVYGPVVVALGASNLLAVAVALRVKYPLNEIHICADDDQFIKENIGMISAVAAAKGAGAKVIWPEFAGLDISGKPTDFNDLHCLGGIELVRKQLLK